MSNANKTVAVVGAGIAGLTTALALRAEGFDVDVYEAAAKPREVGAGITLAPNAMRGLRYVGVEDEIVSAGIEPGMQYISHWQDGRTLVEIDRSGTREQYQVPYIYIHRADLQSLMFDKAHAKGVRVQTGKRLLAIEDPEDSGAGSGGASDTTVLRFADDTSASADLVVGADGLKSVVRGLFQPAPASFTGHIAFRALAPVDESVRHLAEGPGMHIGPGRMAVRYPLRASSILNLVFLARQDGWTEDGWSIPAQRRELEALFEGWCADVQHLIAAARAETLHKWAINAHAPLPTWCRGDRVVLVGDAAHAMTPFLGQGASMAIEDAVVLARALASCDSIGDGLARYEGARLERAHFVQRESNQNADRLQGEEAELYGVGKLRNEETLGLFDYDCSTVSI